MCFKIPLSDMAGSMPRQRAAGGAALLMVAFMYAFWRFGRYWPGVPPAIHGIFRLQQVISLRRPAFTQMQIDQERFIGNMELNLKVYHSHNFSFTIHITFE